MLLATSGVVETCRHAINVMIFTFGDPFSSERFIFVHFLHCTCRKLCCCIRIHTNTNTKYYDLWDDKQSVFNGVYTGCFDNFTLLHFIVWQTTLLHITCDSRHVSQGCRFTYKAGFSIIATCTCIYRLYFFSINLSQRARILHSTRFHNFVFY